MSPIQVYPLNGEYVPAANFSMTFFAPGSFGTVCNSQIDQDYYQAFLKLYNYVSYVVGGVLGNRKR